MPEEELLSLSLAINSDWCSDAAAEEKNRKRKAEPTAFGDGAGDRKLYNLLQTRDWMLRLDPKRHGLEDGKALQLIHLLLLSATAIDGGNVGSAVDGLQELYQNVSLNGDPIQRVTAYFADGLAARLFTRRSPLYAAITAEPTPEEEFSAFTELYRASPYYQFAHFTANQIIYEVFEEEEQHNDISLHVIDFDVSYGFQWPSLLQSLSDKAATGGKPISLRITGFGRSPEELKETKMRLTSFAKGCRNLVFEFDGLLTGSRPSELKIKRNATVVVNLVFYIDALRSQSEICDTLTEIRFLNPSAVVLVEKEDGRQSGRSFLLRFMESLHYFAAMFDSLNDCLPAESTERMSIEKNHLGMEIKRAITWERKEEERLEPWKEWMETIGFEGVKLSSRSVSQAKLLLKIKSHCSAMEYGSGGGGFRIFERDGGTVISLGWQDRNLVTASAWRRTS